MKLVKLFTFLAFSCLLFMSEMTMAQTTAQIGSGSSSSSTRGPFQRADTNSTTVFSRWVQVFTAAELAAAGVTNGVAISELKWELASSNVIIGSGDANLKIYVKNSSATAAVSDTWANHTAGSTLAFDQNFNTSNNFPGANGWMGFVFTSPFIYTGGALEVAVDWDCSTVSTPAFSGNGAIKWRWHSTSPDQLVVKKTSSSAPSTNITDLKDERANIQIVYSMASSCTAPTNLNASNLTATSADFNWAASAGSTSYNWKVVAPGAGAGATAIASGNTTMTMATATGLTALTAYDLHVEADCGGGSTSGYSGAYGFSTVGASNTAIAIGAGTSSSSTRGPFQRSDTNSSTVYSRFVHVYTSAELGAAGIMNGDVITSLNWELASSNVVIGSGDARLKVYIKNSSTTAAVSDTWANHTAGSSLVVDNAYNTTNNFPGASGWMPFNFNQPFTYTGGALEIAVDWDCSQVSTPAFSGDGSLKWRWESTAPDQLVVKKTSSSSPSSSITDLKDERANIQIVTSSATATTVDLTFSVDMSQYGNSFTQVYISGSFNGWSGDANALTDQGNGMWSGTITVPMNDSIEYKFTHDNWAGQEAFAGGEPCTITDPSGQFVNRLIVSGTMNMTVPAVCWNSCDATCPVQGTAPDLPITFQDTATIDYAIVDFGGNISMIVADPTDPMNLVVQSQKTAGSQTWAGTVVADMGLVNPVPFTANDTKMSVRVWSPTANTPVLLKVEDATNNQIASEVLSNTTVAGQWETLEFDFANGTPALNLANTYDKVIIFFDFNNTGNDSTYYWDDVMMVPAPLDTVNITFKVDLSTQDSIASDGVFLAGSFNGWGDTPMSDMDGDSIYEVTMMLLETTSYEFKFKNGANGWENIDLSWDSTCVVAGGFGNRIYTTGSSDASTIPYCFNTCITCDIVIPTKEVALTAQFNMMPNPANDYVQLVFNDEFIAVEKTVFVHNAMGQRVFNTIVSNTKHYGLNTSMLANGMYYITVQTEEGILTKRLVVNH